MAEKLSVIIIVYNEEKNIQRCLESVKWADEIVIVDGFSEDRTEEFCRNYTKSFFQEKWNGFGRQKNICAEKATHKWILNIDADEVVSTELAEEIGCLLQSGPTYPLYKVPRKNFFGSRWIRFGGWYPDQISRLYDKTKIKFSESLVHEKLSPDDSFDILKAPLEHYSYADMEDYVGRQNRYSTLSAQQKKNQGKEGQWSDLLVRPPLAFLKIFFLKQGFREGALGFFLAVSASYYTFLKYAKTQKI
jgi:glycosyltransferase involved in cell wall biosynthesis